MAEKIKRDAFLYLEPKAAKHKKDFAQCKACMMWTGGKSNTCTIHGGSVKVTGGMSCGLYVEGDPMPDHAGSEEALVTAEESGLADRDVRCENCEHGNVETATCELFQELNSSSLFDLDEKISPKGCCNAQTPQAKTIDALRKKAEAL